MLFIRDIARRENVDIFLDRFIKKCNKRLYNFVIKLCKFLFKREKTVICKSIFNYEISKNVYKK